MKKYRRQVLVAAKITIVIVLSFVWNAAVIIINNNSWNDDSFVPFVNSFVVDVPPPPTSRRVHTIILNPGRQQQQKQQQPTYRPSRGTNLLIRSNYQNENEEVVDTTTTTITTTSIGNDDNALGIQEFDEWVRTFDDKKKFYINPLVSHTIFDGGLRGLRWNGNKAVLPKKKNIIIAEIPLSATIRSKSLISSEIISWDTSLVIQLWNEIQLEKHSRYWGYCQLLAPNYSTTKKLDTNTIAPHAIRHWTDQQKKRLLKTDTGQKLLELNNKQQKDWEQKYNTLQKDNKNYDISWEQFVWCMEVVHSRAFTSINGGGQQQQQSLSAIIISIAAPIIAALVGLVYFSTSTTAALDNNNNNNTSELPILIIGTIIAVLPTIVTSFFNNNNKEQSDTGSIDASLLPLIDSANHNDNATDSKIEYNPLTTKYELSIGPNSVSSNNQQIFVRYGNKSNIELLLNYGFLPTVIRNDNDDDDTYRRKLADEFIKIN